MTEIEIKAWLRTPKEHARVLKFLESRGEFVAEVTKKDTYFSKAADTDYAFRLREEGKKFFVTQKKRKLVGNVEENEELEFEILQKEPFLLFVEKQGYTASFWKEKSAKIYRLQSAENPNLFLTAEIVTLKNLGTFLEVEVLCEEEAEKASARQELQRLFDALNLAENIEKKRYIELLKEKI